MAKLQNYRVFSSAYRCYENPTSSCRGDSILSSVLTGVVECSVRSGYRAADLTAKLEKPYALLNDYHKAINEVMVMHHSGAQDDILGIEDDVFGIRITTWVKGCQLTSSYYARVWGWGDTLSGMWHYERRISVIDGLVSLQVTVHGNSICFGCKWRVDLVKHIIADQNVHCFWTRDPNDGSLHVTVGPLPPGMSPFEYLNSLFCVPSGGRGLFVLKLRASDADKKGPNQSDAEKKGPKQSQRKKQRAKARRPNSRHTVH
jgi:hypothetical protein